MALISDSFKMSVEAVLEGEIFTDEDGNLVEANQHKYNYGTINLGGVDHPKNRVPIEHYDEFKKKHPGSKIFFRGPRKGKVSDAASKPAHTLKSDATHFYINNLKEEHNMALVSKNFETAVNSVVTDEFAGLTEEQLIAMAESFESQLEKIKAKIAKKPKDDYDFGDATDKPKSAVTKVSGTYGKSFTDMDDEGKEKATATAATQVKRGRGRPRGSKNV